jgi:GNAT superfamily N-acetyltransferase
MRELPPGWATDLCVLERSGSLIEDRGDHLVIRSPQSPLFHWGNCIFVLDGDAVDDAARWERTFCEAHPAADWVSIGLLRMPSDQTAWRERDLTLEESDVLTTKTVPRRTDPPPGYTFRQLDGDDWLAYVARAISENDRTGEYEPTSHATFVQDQMRARREMSKRREAAFFGAFHGDRLVADLGIVVCGTTARYQSVGTDEDHRARGLASHLLGVAGAWAGDRGAGCWVIVTEATNPAGRVYRRAGFAPDVGNVSAYRRPPMNHSPEA